MKIFSRNTWGSFLIVLGVLILLAALYDSIRPYFPHHPQYSFISNLTSKVPGFLDFSKHPPSGKTSRRASRPLPAAKPPVLPSGRQVEGGLTSNVHQTKGNYDLWVWGVKPERKTGEKVTVKIAHAAASENGGFRIIAYADTNGDGKPDKEIAKSDYLTAQEAGEWSSFEFETPEKRIFVGNTWPAGENVWIFRGNGPWPEVDGIFEDRFYHVVKPGYASSAGPAFTNLKVSFSN